MALRVRNRGGVWYARGTVRYGKSVVAVREFSTGCSDHADALAAAEAEAERIRGEIQEGPQGRARSLTIAECLLAYTNRPGGVRSYDQDRLDDFAERIGHRKVIDATPAWTDWLAERSGISRRVRGKGYSPGTAARHRAVLQAALTYGCEAQGFAAPVLPSVRQPVAEGAVYLTYRLQLRLLASYNRYARQVVIVLCYQGLRSGEALSLDWKAVDLNRKTIVVVKSKSGHARTVPMHPVVERRLWRLWVRRGRPETGRVFLSSRGEPYRVPNETAGDAMGGNPLTRAHITACRRAGVEKFRVHDWRHSWASHMVMAGCDLFTLMKLGGWRSPKMVQRYAAVSDDHMAAMVARMK